MSKASGLLWHDVPNRGGPSRSTWPSATSATSAWRAPGRATTRHRRQHRHGRSREHAGRRPPLAAGADREERRRLDRHRPGLRPHHQPLGPGLAAADRADQPGAVPAARRSTRRSDRSSRATTKSMEGVVSGEQVVRAPTGSGRRCSGGNPFPGPRARTATATSRSASRAASTRPSSTRSSTRRRTRYSSASASPPGAMSATSSRPRRRTTPARRTRSPQSVTHSITRGRSQSGNYLRGWLHLGFNQDEDERQVHDGMWPIIAGRRIALELPLGAARRRARALPGRQRRAAVVAPVPGHDARPAAGAASSTAATRPKTCPKVIEHFGAAEVWALKLTPEWVGTEGEERHPAAEERAPLLHREHDARRRRGRLQCEPARRLPCAELPGQQLRHRRAAGQPAAAHADRQRAARALPQLGHERQRCRPTASTRR